MVQNSFITEALRCAPGAHLSASVQLFPLIHNFDLFQYLVDNITLITPWRFPVFLLSIVVSL